MCLQKAISLLFFLFFIAETVTGQNMLVGKNTIHLNEEFILTLEVPKEQKKQFQGYLFPEIPDFVKVKTQFEEEKKDKIILITQSYRPLKEGKFKMNSFKVKTEEKTITVPAKEITVLHSSPKIKKNTETEDLEFKQEQVDIYFDLTSDKKSVFVGEGFTLTASLLIGENNKVGFNFFNLNEQILSISRKLSGANYLIDKNSAGMIEKLEFDTVRINTKLYKRLMLYQTKVFPINSKDLNLGPIEFSVMKYLTSRKKNSIYWNSDELKLTSGKVKVSIKNLPDHPDKEGAAVGNFQMKEQISAARGYTGKSFRYIIKISGEGNLSAVNFHNVKNNELFDFYSPEIRQQLVKKDDKETGLKTFTYNIIPKEPGDYELSEFFYLVYFNPEKVSYDTLRSDITYTVFGESQKNKTISSTDLGSFYEIAEKESNKLRSKEKDQSIKFFANIIILFMLATTAILIFRR